MKGEGSGMHGLRIPEPVMQKGASAVSPIHIVRTAFALAACVGVGVLGCTSTPPTSTPSNPATGASAVPITPATQTQAIKAAASILQADIGQLQASLVTLTPLSSLTQSAALKQSAAYRTQGSQTASSSNTTITWDDTTKQLTGWTATDSAGTIALTGGGSNARSATVTLTKSPDGTTGSAALAIDAATWSTFVSATDSANVPFQIAYNQLPDLNSLNSVSASVTAVPKGIVAEQVSLSIAGSAFDQIPIATSSLRLPTHYDVSLSVPKVAFKQALDIKKAGATQLALTLAGTVTLKSTKTGTQNWNTSLSTTVDSSTNQPAPVAFSFEDTSMKFKLVGTVQSVASNSATVNGQFVTSDGQTTLGTLSFDSTKGPNPVITFADGTTLTLKSDANADANDN